VSDAVLYWFYVLENDGGFHSLKTKARHCRAFVVTMDLGCV